MKVNVGNGEIQGYLNQPEKLDLNDIEDASCTEILAPSIVNVIHYTKIQDILTQWYAKLRLKGVVILGGYDLVEFSKSVIRYEISKEEKNSIIAASGSFFPLDEITQLVCMIGFKIKKRQLNGIRYTLELTRE